MKRLLMGIGLVILLIGCDNLITSYTTLNEAAQSYVDELGPPEEIKTFDSGDYHTVDYWWWTKGVCHSFIDSPYDNYNGWRWESTYTFDPIY